MQVGDLSNILDIVIQIISIPRRWRTKRANQDWIDAWIFLTMGQINTSPDLLNHIQSGIAEMHNIYTKEMISAEAAMRAALIKIAKDTHYSMLLRRSFYNEYSKYYTIAQECHPLEDRNPIMENRRINFLWAISVLLVIIGGSSLITWISKDQSWKVFIDTIFTAIEAVGILIFLATIFAVFMELTSTDQVDYHSHKDFQRRL